LNPIGNFAHRKRQMPTQTTSMAETGQSGMAHRMLMLVALGQFLGMTLWFSATAAAPSVAREFSLDTSTRAWLTMAVQAGFVAGTLLTALTNAADVINARRLFVIGAIAAAAMNAAIAFMPTAAAIVALRFGTGAALAWVYPPGLKIAAGWFRENRGAALGLVVGALTIGSAFPHLLAWLGAGLPWRTLVCISSGLAVAGAALIGLTVQDGPYVSASAPFDRHALGVVLRNRGVRLAILGYLGHMWELYAVWTWIPAFAVAALIDGSSTAGSLVAFVTIASGAVGCVLAGYWADRWGKPQIAGAAMVGSAACALLSPFAFHVSLMPLLILATIWGFTVVADSAQFSALVAEHSPPTHVGTALTLQISSGFLLTMVSMRLVPHISTAFGWQWAFLTLVPGPLLGAWMMYLLTKSMVASRQSSVSR
jgi:MFS family permease